MCNFGGNLLSNGQMNLCYVNILNNVLVSFSSIVIKLLLSQNFFSLNF